MRVPATIAHAAAGHRFDFSGTKAEIAVASRRGLSYLFERIFYHGFVGAFLASIPFLCMLTLHVIPALSNPSVGGSAFVVVVALYVRRRVKADLQPKRERPFLEGWGPYFRMLLHFIVHGGVIGGASAMALGHPEPCIFAGAISFPALVAFLHHQKLREDAELIDQNKQEIDRWVAEGTDEEEVSRRRAYAASGALFIGAAAAGGSEYEGAPTLRWPSGIEYSLPENVGCDDSNWMDGIRVSSSWESDSYESCFGSGNSWSSVDLGSTWCNPATGLPTIDGMCGSIDVGGHMWGSSD